MKTLYVHLKNYCVQILSLQLLLRVVSVNINVCLVFVRSSFEQTVQTATYEHTVGQVMIRSAQPLFFTAVPLFTDKRSKWIGRSTTFSTKARKQSRKNRRELREYLEKR